MKTNLKKRILWITDAWEKLDHPWDTTLRVVQEADQMGINQSICSVADLYTQNDMLYVTAKKIQSVGLKREESDFKLSKSFAKPIHFYTDIVYRKDPPVANGYLLPLQLVWLYTRHTKTRIHNPAEALLKLNEKLTPLTFKKLSVAGSIVFTKTQITDSYLRFGYRVLKPLTDAASRGVRVFDTGLSTEDLTTQLANYPENLAEPMVLQRFEKQILQGETRLWFVRGKLLEVAKKIPGPGTAIVDLYGEGRVETCKLTKEQKTVARILEKFLKSEKIVWAAVDCIGPKITDINITSPGMIPEMEDVTGKNLARKLLNGILQKN